MTRGQRQKIAAATLEICKRGLYMNPDGVATSIKISTAKIYLPSSEYQLPPNPGHAMKCSVVDATTLDAGYPYRDQKVCLLNFASAKNPGGGFIKGSQAQEEALARASALYWTLKDCGPYYKLHTSKGSDPSYTDGVIYSPKVPVFRSEDAGLLDEPWYPDIVTCAAPNAGALRKRNWAGDIRKAFKLRIDRMLTITAINAPDVLVLGAWGCGVFGNDPKMVAELFHEALTTKFRGYFPKVVFGIPFHPKNRTPFEEMFR